MAWQHVEATLKQTAAGDQFVLDFIYENTFGIRDGNCAFDRASSARSRERECGRARGRPPIYILARLAAGLFSHAGPNCCARRTRAILLVAARPLLPSSVRPTLIMSQSTARISQKADMAELWAAPQMVLMLEKVEYRLK